MLYAIDFGTPKLRAAPRRRRARRPHLEATRWLGARIAKRGSLVRMDTNPIRLLRNSIQNYAWGSGTAIPERFGQSPLIGSLMDGAG